MTKYIKAGYVGERGLASVTEKAARSLDVINIAFGHCKSSEISFDAGHKTEISAVREKNPDIKILLSVGGWGSGGFSPMAATPSGREKFAASAVRLIKEADLDGIDIDWEYPCIDSAGIEASPGDKHNFTLMMAELRRALDTVPTSVGGRPWLTAAVGAGEYFINNTEIDRVVPEVDYLSIMTYDMRGSWSNITGHHANLYKPENAADDPASVEYSVEIYNKAGLPPEKTVIGAAFYSRKWDGVRNENNGYLQLSEGNGGYGPDYTALYNNYINKNGYTRFWDSRAKAPYLFNGDSFISYDDEESIKEKCDFIIKRGLLGIMYWEHDCDKTGRLLDAINEAFKSKK